ncbi:MAG: GlsB/YeaQ/YmgE family stress response membrane protein [Euzebya sp.]
MIGFIVAGLVIGAVARLIKPGKQRMGLLATLLVGVVASVIGGAIASLLGTGNVWELNVLGMIVAIISAVVILGAINAGATADRT